MSVRPHAGPAGPLSGVEEIRESVASGNSTIGAYIEWLDSYGIQVGNSHVSLWTASVALAVVLGVFLFARLGSRLAHWSLGKLTSLDQAQKLLAEKLITVAVWILAMLIGIDLLGIDLTALAVFSGAFGLAIGFGLQKTFGNLISGIILLMDRSIKPGDVIAVSDMAGRESFGQIRKIGIRAISVTTRDKKEYLIPNENLMINQVENWSYSARDVRVKAPVTVAYDTDIELAESLMLEAAKASPRVLVEPEPKVLLIGFGEKGFDFEIRFWIVDPEEGISSVISEVLKRSWRLFKENGVSVPLPLQDIRLRDSTEFDQLIEALSRRPKGGESGA